MQLQSTSDLRKALCATPDDAGAWYRLGLSQNENSSTDGRGGDWAFVRALALEPTWKESRDGIALKGHKAPNVRLWHRPTPWPSKMAQFEDLERLVSTYIFRPEGETKRFLTRDSRLFTFGSCFATNLSKALLAQGYQSFHLNFNEELNI